MDRIKLKPAISVEKYLLQRACRFTMNYLFWSAGCDTANETVSFTYAFKCVLAEKLRIPVVKNINLFW